MSAISEIPQVMPIQENNMVKDPEITQPNLDPPNIDNVPPEPAKETDFVEITAEKNNDINDITAERDTPINDIQYNEYNENQELLDNTKQKDSLPAIDITPRSRSQSPNESPAPTRIVAVNLFPLTDSIVFSPKHLTFLPDQEIKIGRVSGSRNQKEAKAENGVFICDVMSREHAMLKEANGKILIKDTKSTHGTFVNSTRLGDGSQDSEWKELKHGDVITFGHSVRRNQSLYKHLSAYVFYPKEKRELPPIPIAANGASQNRELPQVMPAENLEIPAVSSNITKEPTTTDNFAVPMPMKVEEVLKDPKSTNSVIHVLPRNVAVSNLHEANSTNELTSVSVVKQKSLISTAMKQDRRPAPLDNRNNTTRFEVSPVKEEIISPEDFLLGNNNDDHDKQLIRQVPFVPPSPPPFEATENMGNSLQKNTFVPPLPISVREKGTQTYRELKHSKVLRKENKDDKEINEEFVPVNNNVEKIEEVKRDEVRELEEKIAILEDHANKRRKWERFTATMIGMFAGVVSVGFGAYLLGN
ncbi:3988_t:CDS:2 [Diversispora eburnea]|uniref:3988_t:CDS:1 n=1 Tax=Diversispora eburnea TaxID=1213867 RepID=A0A9N9AZE7_9GLOM|nr:3988_t:CDS:2 [Diversispora eburnea]